MRDARPAPALGVSTWPARCRRLRMRPHKRPRRVVRRVGRGRAGHRPPGWRRRPRIGTARSRRRCARHPSHRLRCRSSLRHRSPRLLRASPGKACRPASRAKACLPAWAACPSRRRSPRRWPPPMIPTRKASPTRSAPFWPARPMQGPRQARRGPCHARSARRRAPTSNPCQRRARSRRVGAAAEEGWELHQPGGGWAARAVAPRRFPWAVGEAAAHRRRRIGGERDAQVPGGDDANCKREHDSVWL